MKEIVTIELVEKKLWEENKGIPKSIKRQVEKVKVCAPSHAYIIDLYNTSMKTTTTQIV